ncbi:MAG: ABC transporter ATP-binding protein [Hyphomicrobiales bacterium]|jgi:ABC-2 type transport system ATP-binding protein|nr:ABC transporter ATP-binding protein [Hyphomicrobiales bacterium]
MTVIAVDGLTKRFAGKTVVDHISMHVEKGEIVGFLGPNGSGKTTTIRMICGLLKPDGGSGTCLGYDIRTESDRIKAEVGYMTQAFSFYEDLTVRENLEFVARLYRLRPQRAHVDAAIDKLGMRDRQHQLAGELSGGWKQRLALAACVMHEPKLLLLDEPTAGVDPKARREFWDEVHNLAAEGVTVLVSTHYMDEAERCHRIAYISYGRIIAEGTTDEVVARAGLSTWVVAGKGLDALAGELRRQKGIDQVATFGTTLHVIGADDGALKAAIAPFRDRPGLTWSKGETSLEDVFIQFMGVAQTGQQ